MAPALATPVRSPAPHRRAARTALLLGAALLLATCERTSPTVPGDDVAGLARYRGHGQAAVVDTELPDAPAVRVVDAFGKGVPGVVVTFTPIDGSIAAPPQAGEAQRAAEPGTVLSDANGVATAPRWRLGTAAGSQTLTASAHGLAPVTFGATALPGAPAGMSVSAGSSQSAPAGAPVPVRPAVVLQDAYGNRVPGVAVTFVVSGGGGSVQGGATLSDATGVATVGSWTLGPSPGTNGLEARLADLAPVAFSAEGEPSAGFNLAVEAVHLNQGSQTDQGTIGGVAGRPGILRVFVRASAPNDHAPVVRVRLYQGALLLREVVLKRAAAGVPTDPDRGKLGDSWNLVLTAAEVVPGLAVEVVVDPDGLVPETNRLDNRFPRAVGAASLDVRTLPPFRVLFIPIVSTVQGTTGNVTADNVDGFLQRTLQWIPTGTIVRSVRAPFTTTRNLSQGSEWSLLLADIQALRVAEGATDQYYHGIIGDFSGVPYGGLAYRPSNPGSSFRSGLSYDRRNVAAEVVAHELGHNLGRMHASCGNPGTPDPNYPHPNGRIGAHGYDIVNGVLISETLADFMGYCRPRWTSDYTYAAILDWRRADPWGSSAMAAVAAAGAEPTSGLLVWGVVTASGVTLNPAFALTARPSLPAESGPYTLRGVGSDGAEVFRLSFAGERPADTDDPAERHFAYFVPLSEARISALGRIEVLGPQGGVVQRSAGAGVGPGGAPAQPGVPPGVALAPAPGGRVAVTWDAERFPMALVRDRETGQVLGFLRSGDAAISAGTLPPGNLEVLLSDGVSSRPAAPR